MARETVRPGSRGGVAAAERAEELLPGNAAAEEELLPGSEAAEAAADALLARAKSCGLRVALCLHAAAEGSGRGPGLRRAADEIALSCAYYTDGRLERRLQAQARLGVNVPAENLDDGDAADGKGVAWLSGLVEEGLEHLAGSLGLSPSQAVVWAEHVRGETQEEIARALGTSRMATWVHLGRAHRRVSDSWLAAYHRSLRRG